MKMKRITRLHLFIYFLQHLLDIP